MSTCFEILEKSFVADDENPSFASTLVRILTFSVSFFLAAWTLKPDLFGLVPNGLDPMFYTGYSINLDDALAAAGNQHYFVTRWSSYIPQYLSTQLFGPYWGRIILRLLMLSVLSEVMWRIGRRLGLSAITRFTATLIVLMFPMFVRSFTTDYTEYSVTFYGTLLVALVVTQPLSAKWASIFGGLAALLVIANPFTFVMTSIATLAWSLKEQKFRQIHKLLGLVLLALMSFAIVFVLGYLLFRFYFQIGNVYQPTFDFIKASAVPPIDYWTAPSITWLWHFGWLYIPVLLVIVSHYLVRPKEEVAQKINLWTQVIVIFVFVAHVYIQINRGHALETSFYWSMALPPVYILLFLVLGHFIENARRFHMGLSSLGIFVLLIFFEIPQKFPLGAGVALVLCLSALIGGLLLLNYRTKALLAPVFVVGLVWMQIGSPSYTQLTYGGDRNTPRYDLVYGSVTQSSKKIWEETIWFTQQMDQVEDDWKSSFLSSGDWSGAIVGTYIAHPFSRWISALTDESVLPANVRDELEFGYRKYLVLYGNQPKVAENLIRVRSQLPHVETILDEVHNKGLEYRLVVLSRDVKEPAAAEIPMSRLFRNIGTANSDGSVSVVAGTPSDFASFGPYFGLGPGSYTAILHYKTASESNLGQFQVFNDRTAKWSSTELTGSNSAEQTAAVTFDVTAEDTTWQLRTFHTGEAAVQYKYITLEKLAKDG